MLDQLLSVPDNEFPEWSAVAIFLVIVVLTPILETLLFQALPIFVARKLNAPFIWQIIASIALFAGMHLAEGIITFFAVGLIGGFYLAFSYAHWRQKSRWTAFWVTAVLHAFHNAVVFALLALSGEL